MLSIKARDGAARLGDSVRDGRRLDVPNILWVESELADPEALFEPQLAGGPSTKATMIVASRFDLPTPAAQTGQVVLRRELLAPPSMAPTRIRLLELGDEIAVFHGAYSLAQNPRRFAPALERARAQAGHAKLLYAPGLGEPASLALLAYAGVDLFDSVPLSLAAAQGIYLTEHGASPAAKLASAECPCPACRFESPQRFTETELRRHNQHAARAELGVVRNAIANGRLRELVEARVRAHPELTALLRRIDQHAGEIERRTPIARHEKLFANTKESLRRPDIVRFRERIATRYRPDASAPILVLFPCSHRKPYGRSRTHRTFAQALIDTNAQSLVHELIVTSPLGVVPRELETTYPAAHYDVPVTGEWDPEEATIIRDLVAKVLSYRTYPHVISHLPKHTYEIVRDLLPATTVVTCQTEDATRAAEMTRLRDALAPLVKQHRRAHPQMLLERIRGIATYQFGPEAAQALTQGASAQGRWPVVKIAQGRTQLAMLPPERGLLSLTLDGGKRIAPLGVYRVEIEDFPVTGSIFAVGVKDADPNIRVGDEVVVTHGNDVRAVGVATMSGPEMVECRRGEAVKVRHHA